MKKVLFVMSCVTLVAFGVCLAQGAQEIYLSPDEMQISVGCHCGGESYTGSSSSCQKDPTPNPIDTACSSTQSSLCNASVWEGGCTTVTYPTGMNGAGKGHLTLSGSVVCQNNFMEGYCVWTQISVDPVKFLCIAFDIVGPPAPCPGSIQEAGTCPTTDCGKGLH